MNTLAKIALGTVATGAVALAATSPVMAAPQTPGVDMSVASPTTISNTAPAYLGSNGVTQTTAPAVATHTVTAGEYHPAAYTTHATMTRHIGRHDASGFGCGIFTNTAANHLNDR